MASRLNGQALGIHISLGSLDQVTPTLRQVKMMSRASFPS